MNTKGKSILAVLTAAALAFSSLLLTPARVQAATIVVTTTADENGAGGACSLREAIIAANTNKPFGGCPAGSGADLIVLPAGVFRIEINGVDDKGGDLDIKESVTISGVGPQTRILAVSTLNDRVFHINAVANQTLDVKLSNLTVEGGFVSDGAGGGGILNDGEKLTLNRVTVINNNSSNIGGGIANRDPGELIVTGSEIIGNKATSSGGGIYNEGNLTVSNSLLMDNSARTGGGLDNNPKQKASQSATVTNSTIAKNSSNEEMGSTSGGIASSGKLTLVNNTIANNTGAGLWVYSYTTRVQNTMIVGNTQQPNCVVASYAGVESLGYNIVPLSTNPGNIFTATGDNTSTTTQVYLSSDLAYVGSSPTKVYTFSNLSSAAVDAIPPGAYCPSMDQRFYGRPADGNKDGLVGCDIGAYEEGAIQLLTFLPTILK